MSLITRSHPRGGPSPTASPALPLAGASPARLDQVTPRPVPRPSVQQLLDAEWIIGAELVDHGAVVHRTVLPDQCSACGRLRGRSIFEHQARVIKERLLEAGLMGHLEPRGRTAVLLAQDGEATGGPVRLHLPGGVRTRAVDDDEVPTS